MGCGASKSSSTLDPNLKGTTLIGFVYSGGIVVGAESRASNEIEELKHPLQIRDNTTKMTELSSHIIYVVQGVKNDCDAMDAYMRRMFPYVDNAGPGYAPYSVSNVVETMYNYLKSLNDENIACGAIIAGWDASGPQVHRVFLKKREVWKERSRGPAALGSGQIYAIRIFRRGDGYTYNMTTAYATELAFKGLFNATYYDKHSGGELKVYHIDGSSGVLELTSRNALEAYMTFYDLRLEEEPKTLFLVVDAGTKPPISAKDLVEHFKPDARLFASHRVALLEWGYDLFYFHRLVFETEDDAVKAYGTTTPHGQSTPYLRQFPGQVILNKKQPSVTVYVNWSSRELLHLLRAECQLLYR